MHFSIPCFAYRQSIREVSRSLLSFLSLNSTRRTETDFPPPSLLPLALQEPETCALFPTSPSSTSRIEERPLTSSRTTESTVVPLVRSSSRSSSSPPLAADHLSFDVCLLFQVEEEQETTSLPSPTPALELLMALEDDLPTETEAVTLEDPSRLSRRWLEE